MNDPKLVQELQRIILTKVINIFSLKIWPKITFSSLDRKTHNFLLKKLAYQKVEQQETNKGKTSKHNNLLRALLLRSYQSSMRESLMGVM